MESEQQPNRRPKVLVTGASGLIGGLVVRNLADKYEFSGLNRRPVDGIPVTQADIRDAEAIKPAFQGMDMVVHLSAETHDLYNWDKIMSHTIQGTLNVLVAAQEAGVKRVILGGSGGAMCGYEFDKSLPYGALAQGRYEEAGDSWPLLDHTDPPRPDAPYSIGKLFGENAGRWFSDYYDMSVLCIRLGAVLDTDRPKLLRHFPGFLSQADCVQIIEKSLDAPPTLKFAIYDALSENKYRWRDTTYAKEVLGFRPTGTADLYNPDDYR
jgi:nucleoside-diphosphate-sugar epimerase